MTVKTLVDKFLAWCKRHRAENTVKHYTSRLKPFLSRCGTRDFCDLSPLDIDEYLYAASDGKSNDTKRANIVVLETLQNWALKNKQIENRVFEKLEKPTGSLRERIPTEAETKAILKAASPEFRLIYSALRQSGARPNELCRATTENYDRENGAIELKEHKTANKTKRPRVISVGKKLASIIHDALGDRTQGFLFHSPRGKPWKPGNLSRTFRVLRDKLDLPKDLCLYLTRHEHATRICERQGIHAASRSLGHASIQTTQRYVKDDVEKLKSVQDSFDG